MIDVRDAELGDCQRAARSLLVHGVVTQTRPSDREWRNVRRYAEPLDAAFREIAGYSVAVSRTAVRLVRRLDRLTEAPILTTPSRRPFDRVRYALVVLALAALERSGTQTTLTDLARRIRRAADQTDGLPFDPDNHAARLALGHAVRALEELGALTLTDGSRAAWEQGDDNAEALYDIDRSMCRQVFALPRGLRQEMEELFLHTEATDIGRDPARRSRRQRLARHLLERPVMYFSDLDEADRAFLHKEARPLVARLEALTGAHGERRREGIALVDPGRHFSDQAFPRGGSEQQAALLLATRLCALTGELPEVDAAHGLEPSDHRVEALSAAAPEASSTRSPPIRPRTPHPFVDDARLQSEATRLRDEMSEALKASYRDDASVFLEDALRVLAAYDLVRPLEGGVTLMPAIARFREVEVDAPPELVSQLGLFGSGR